MPSIDGKRGAPGLFGFQDMVARIADPMIANCSPRSAQAELVYAVRTWRVQGVNTQALWNLQLAGDWHVEGQAAANMAASAWQSY